MKKLDERELRLILNCMDYAKNDPAGFPGHVLILILAKVFSRSDIEAELASRQNKEG